MNIANYETGGKMITIQITDAKEIVKLKKGALAAWIGSKIYDLEDKVEEELVKHLRDALDEEGIKVTITRT